MRQLVVQCNNFFLSNCWSMTSQLTFTAKQLIQVTLNLTQPKIERKFKSDGRNIKL